jgi:uncharacterized OB-fold protein
MIKKADLTAFKCKQCGAVMFPKHERCLNCKGREFEKIEPSGRAKLLTYTILNELPWGIDERGRVIGIVEFENGVRATGLVNAEQPKLGMKLQASLEPVRVISGIKTYGLTLTPVK